jgi:Cell Wall Hydrolase
MTSENYIKSLACLLAWREEASNGVNGMLAVLFVVANRAKADWEMGDWNKIITAHNQFSSMSVSGDGQLVHYPDPHDTNFNKVLQFVDGIYDGSLQDNLTSGSVYYADLTSPGYQKGGWFDRVILGNPNRFPSVAKVGTTTYFSDKGA